MPNVPPSSGLVLALAFAGLNLAIGGIVSAFKLPIYLDSLGIVLAAVLLGWRWGLVTALVTVTVGFFIINPYLPFYVVTALGIAVASEILFQARMFNSMARSVVSGLVIALISATLSAPVTAYLGGNTLSGVDAITAFMLATGRSLWEAVLITGLTSEPIDKVLVCTLAFLTISRLPRRTIDRTGMRSLPR